MSIGGGAIRGRSAAVPSRKHLVLVIAVGAGAALAALAWSHRAERLAPAPVASASGTSDADLRQAKSALDTLTKLEKAAVADNARAGYLARRDSRPSPACVDRMHREQLTTHETLRALSKLPDTVPGISALRRAVFQVHICVSCTESADDYCARAETLLGEARGLLSAP